MSDEKPFHYSTCHYVRYQGHVESVGAPCNCEIRRQAEIDDQKAKATAEMFPARACGSDNCCDDQSIVCDRVPGAWGVPASQYEEVDHPAHYGGDTPYEPIKVMEAWQEMFNLPINSMMAIKYLVRAGTKPGADLETDLKKALWHVEREITRTCPLCSRQCPDQVESLKWKIGTIVPDRHRSPQMPAPGRTGNASASAAAAKRTARST